MKFGALGVLIFLHELLNKLSEEFSRCKVSFSYRFFGSTSDTFATCVDLSRYANECNFLRITKRVGYGTDDFYCEVI